METITGNYQIMSQKKQSYWKNHRFLANLRGKLSEPPPPHRAHRPAASIGTAPAFSYKSATFGDLTDPAVSGGMFQHFLVALSHSSFSFLHQSEPSTFFLGGNCRGYPNLSHATHTHVLREIKQSCLHLDVCCPSFLKIDS